MNYRNQFKEEIKKIGKENDDGDDNITTSRWLSLRINFLNINKKELLSTK